MHNADQQDSLDVGRYWALVQHRRWWLIASIVVGWALVFAMSWGLPSKYRSETMILVEQQKVPERYVVPNVASDIQDRLQSMTQQILSRTRLLAIIDKFQLYQKGANNADPDALVGQMRKDISIDLVRAQGHEGELTAFKVAYSARNPVLAQQVTGELTSLFIAENLRNRQQMSEDTTAFLENQLQSARKDLEFQEEKLRDFRSRFLGELPEQLQGNVQILSGLQARLQSSTEALNHAEQQRLYLESLLGQYRSAPGGDGSGSSSGVPALSVLDQQLEKMRAQLADISGRYTPRHPDIVRLKEQIATVEKLRQKIEEDLQSGKKSDSSPSALTNPAAMQIESQIKVTQMEIASRKRQIAELDSEIRQYEGRLNLTPVREQQLAGITRDYQQSRANYESLLAKKQQSELATNLEKRQQGEQFRVLDPPNLPRKPYFPNRLLFSLGGIGFGTALGLGLIVLTEMADPRIYREEDLADLAPVLVGIPVLQTSAEIEQAARRRWIEVGVVCSMLIFIPAITIVAYLKS